MCTADTHRVHISPLSVNNDDDRNNTTTRLPKRFILVFLKVQSLFHGWSRCERDKSCAKTGKQREGWLSFYNNQEASLTCDKCFQCPLYRVTTKIKNKIHDRYLVHASIFLFYCFYFVKVTLLLRLFDCFVCLFVFWAEDLAWNNSEDPFNWRCWEQMMLHAYYILKTIITVFVLTVTTAH